MTGTYRNVPSPARDTAGEPARGGHVAFRPRGRGQMAPRTIGEVTLQGYRCCCGHEWMPRNKGERPRVCPKCKSPNWDRPKRAAA